MLRDHVAEQKVGKRVEIVIYHSADGLPAMEVRLEQETFWSNLNQIAALFERDKSVISKHIELIRTSFLWGEV